MIGSEEIWKSVKDYEGLYEISSLGRLRSLPKLCGLSPRKLKIKKSVADKYGYLRVPLYKNGVAKNKQIHRLVAEAFIPNPNGYDQVNHRDENKQNNVVSNLEWCDTYYNSNYGSRNNTISVKMKGKNINSPSLSKRVAQYTKDGTLITIYQSSMEAYRKTGCDSSSIIKCCKGKLKSTKGYVWHYA